MHNLDSVSDSESYESYDSYSKMSDFGDRLSRLEGIIELISNTTEEGLAITLESYPVCASSDINVHSTDWGACLVLQYVSRIQAYK